LAAFLAATEASAAAFSAAALASAAAISTEARTAYDDEAPPPPPPPLLRPFRQRLSRLLPCLPPPSRLWLSRRAAGQRQRRAGPKHPRARSCHRYCKSPPRPP
jgi:hypothetical protein